MPCWHLEVTALTLRRYPAADTQEQAAAAWLGGQEYDGAGQARIDLGRATIGPLLVAGPAMRRAELRQLEAQLRRHGAKSLEITRHGRLIVRED